MLTLHGEGSEFVAVDLPRFDAADGSAGLIRRGVPARRIAGQLVTTVFDLLLAQYGVGRDGLPGQWPASYDDAGQPSAPVPITALQARVSRPHRQSHMSPLSPQRRGRPTIEGCARR